MVKWSVSLTCMVGIFVSASLSFADYQPKIDDDLISVNRFKNVFYSFLSNGVSAQAAFYLGSRDIS